MLQRPQLLSSVVRIQQLDRKSPYSGGFAFLLRGSDGTLAERAKRVQDFSFSTGGSSFVELRRVGIEGAFGLSFRAGRGGEGFGDWLEVTAQAWKGLSRVTSRPLDSWKNPDLVKMVGYAMFAFMETVTPLSGDFFGVATKKRVRT